MFGLSIKVSPQIRVALANCHKRAVPSSCSSNRRGDSTVKMKTLALVAAGSIALLGGSNAFAQCNFNAWLPGNGNTGGAAIQDGLSITSPTGSGNLKPGSPREATNPVARFSGRCGLRANGPTNYVQDGSPNETGTFRARFYVRATSVTGGSAVVYRALNSASSNVFSVSYDPAGSGSFVVSTGTGGGTSSFGPVTAGAWYSVEVNWATSPASSLATTIRGNGANADLVGTGNPISNFGTISGGVSVDTVQLGFVAGPATAGQVFVDAYESRRQNPIGRLCRGDADAAGTAGAGVIQVNDAILIANEVTSPVANPAYAQGQPDCNQNGSVEVGDALCVSNRAFVSNVCTNNP
jgi:hypothetical protein